VNHDPRFEELMREAMRDTERFGHRQHIKLTWLAVLRYGTEEATRLVSSGIRGTARYAGAPQKYNNTVSRAWVELVGHHATEARHRSFEKFIEVNPALLDKRLLSRFYRSATLAGVNARTGWVEPDLDDFPWR
jgi:hypothetical protein